MQNGKPKSEPNSKSSGEILNHILVNEVGQFGRYQIWIVILILFPNTFVAFSTGEYIFTVPRTPTRCLVPQCDNEVADFSAPWLQYAIPPTANGGFDNCGMFANNTAVDTGIEPGNNCSASLFDVSTVVKCQEFVYENTNSAVYDFNLACDEWKRSLVGSVRSLGVFIMLPITGYISDRWGRRVALVINGFGIGCVGLARSFATSYKWFLALEIIEGSFGPGAFSSCYIIVSELVGPQYRVLVAVINSSWFAVTQMLLGVVAWKIPHWRTLTRVIYTPPLLLLIYFWILADSVRWLMSRGRYQESEKILIQVAKRNKRHITDISLEALKASAQAENLIKNQKEPWLIVQVLKSHIILTRCLTIPIWWVTAALVYYGMSINAVNLSGNSYLNYVIVAAIEIPGFWTAFLLLDRIGRKPVLSAGYFVCAACQFTLAFLPEEKSKWALVLYLIGKYSIAGVFTALYIYTAELFPTKYRHNLFNFSSMVGRLGSLMAPLTPALAQEVWVGLPPVLFGSCALLSGLLIFTTPETLGTTLPDTIHEAEKIGTKKIVS